MNFFDRSMIALALIIPSICLWAVLIWEIKQKKILRGDIPAKDWKIINKIFYFGLTRHEEITTKNHPNIYKLTIIVNIIAAVVSTALAIIIFFVG